MFLYSRYLTSGVIVNKLYVVRVLTINNKLYVVRVMKNKFYMVRVIIGKLFVIYNGEKTPFFIN